VTISFFIPKRNGFAALSNSVCGHSGGEKEEGGVHRYGKEAHQGKPFTQTITQDSKKNS